MPSLRKNKKTSTHHFQSHGERTSCLSVHAEIRMDTQYMIGKICGGASVIKTEKCIWKVQLMLGKKRGCEELCLPVLENLLYSCSQHEQSRAQALTHRKEIKPLAMRKKVQLYKLGAAFPNPSPRITHLFFPCWHQAAASCFLSSTVREQPSPVVPLTTKTKVV